MRLCKNELLLMGGMYQILVFILAFSGSDIGMAMSGILYVLFWAAVLALSLALVPSWEFLHNMNDRFPKISLLLASIGWIPYFTVFYALMTYVVDFFVGKSDSITVYLNYIVAVEDVYFAAVVLSILYAVYRMIRGEDLEMSCWAPM